MYCGIDKSNVHVLYKPYFQQYALYIIYWIKALIALPLFCSDFFNGDDTMDTILDMTKKKRLPFVFVYYKLMLHGTIYFVHVG